MADTVEAIETSAAGKVWDWEDHLRLTSAVPPRPMLVRALPHVRNKAHALDLGAGALNDSRHLLSIGFEKVTALDAMRPTGVVDLARIPHFEFVQSRFEDFSFPAVAFDFINAQFALPFTPAERFPAVFDGIITALRPGGVFVGELFGTSDAWAPDPGMTFHDPAEARRLLTRDSELLYFCEEEDWHGSLANGDAKHWHILYFTVRKRE